MYFDVEYEDFSDKTLEKEMDDYEKKDVDDFLKRYPYMKLLSRSVVYELQKYFNNDWLCAGWCCCACPEELIEKYVNKMGNKEK